MHPRLCYGYISLGHDDEQEIGRLHDIVSAYALVEGLTVAEIYVDRNTALACVTRPGFTVLLDILVRGEVCAVLIPTHAHLSPVAEIRRSMTAELEARGASVVIIDSLAVSGSLPRQQQPLRANSATDAASDSLLRSGMTSEASIPGPIFSEGRCCSDPDYLGPRRWSTNP